MKWLAIALVTLNVAWAEHSKVTPVFIEAARIYSTTDLSSEKGLYLRPDVRAALRVLEKSNVSPEFFKKYIELAEKKSTWLLPAADHYDRWTTSSQKSEVEAPEVSLHAIKLDVIEESDDWAKDDIYAYFFITDGLVPTGRVTSVYKGISSGEAFFFNEIDRAIYPVAGALSKKPVNHLIVDYGIIESDGEDIKELQKISDSIIDLAIAVYSALEPQSAGMAVGLRKEIQALTKLIIGLNEDDRLVTGSFGYKVEEITEFLSQKTYLEFKKKHGRSSTFDSWEYQIWFRLIKK